MLNPTHLERITGYILEYDVGDSDLNHIPQKRLKLIDVSISSYCSIINSTKRINIIKQTNKLAVFVGDIESD